MALRWYAGETKSQLEEFASQNVSDQNFDVFLPMYVHGLTRDRKEIKRPLYPGYLFFAFDVERDRWQSICSTPGMRSILGVDRFSENPTPIPIPSKIIDDVRRMSFEMSFPVVFANGAALSADMRVRVIEGPLKNLDGFIVSCRGRRALVQLDNARTGRPISILRESVVGLA